MKKLLLSLGALSAVVAPVAAVVACGSTDDSSKKLASETKAKLESSLKNHGYTMDAAELTKLISALGKDARIISVSTGKEVKEDGTHGANDLLILVKSGKARHVESEKFSDDFTGNEEKQVETLSVSGAPIGAIGVRSDANHYQVIGSILKSSDSNWNIKSDDLKEATKALYIQSGTTTTVELADLMVNADGDVFAINSALESAKVFPAKFSLKEFTATHS